ncbi:MAG: metallophosphoesterase, partial [Lachnospiraceae bacterium]|nr:metallophosphoesterase [Lachnospiraceae bacterium]
MSDDEYRIVVVSDDHGHTGTLLEIAEREMPFDLLIHCGDSEEDLFAFFADADFEVAAVAGNMDWYPYPQELLLEAAGKRIFVCHGHRYGVKYTNEHLKAAAMSHKADIVLYGHTHRAEEEYENGVIFFNPGSTSYTYGGRVNTYGTICIREYT